MYWEIIVQAFWFILPAYVANACAVLVGGGNPIDKGNTWRDGNRILGDGKTWRGLIVGALLGMICGFGLSVAAKYIEMSGFGFIGLTDFMGFPGMIFIVFSIAFGALLGDIIESFLKRRIDIKRGEDWIPFDQLDFILGAFLFSFITAGLIQLIGFTTNNWFLTTLNIWHIAFLLFISPFFHILANFLHKKLKTKTS